MRHSKDSAYLLSKGYIKLIKDTLEIEDSPDDEDLKKEKAPEQKTPAEKDSAGSIKTNAAILPDRQKKSSPDSSQNKKP
jgi:hypothetical protein